MAAEVTGEKVLFAILCMASAEDPPPTNRDAMATACNVLMSDFIAKLLQDESGEERMILLDRMKTLWAVHEEHVDDREGPIWER